MLLANNTTLISDDWLIAHEIVCIFGLVIIYGTIYILLANLGTSNVRLSEIK